MEWLYYLSSQIPFVGGLLSKLLKPDSKSLTNKDNKGGIYSTTINCITTRRYGASVHFGVMVVELINGKCGGIVRNQIW